MGDPDKEIVDHLAHLTDAVEKYGLARAPGNSANGNVMRIEGAGGFWNGISIGVTLGAVIVLAVWVASKMQQMDIRTQQSEAYKAAVYMVAPRLAEEIDKELDRQKEIKHEYPDSRDYPAAQAEAQERAAPGG